MPKNEHRVMLGIRTRELDAGWWLHAGPRRVGTLRGGRAIVGGHKHQELPTNWRWPKEVAGFSCLKDGTRACACPGVPWHLPVDWPRRSTSPPSRSRRGRCPSSWTKRTWQAEPGWLRTRPGSSKLSRSGRRAFRRYPYRLVALGVARPAVRMVELGELGVRRDPGVELVVLDVEDVVGR